MVLDRGMRSRRRGPSAAGGGLARGGGWRLRCGRSCGELFGCGASGWFAEGQWLGLHGAWKLLKMLLLGKCFLRGGIYIYVIVKVDA